MSPFTRLERTLFLIVIAALSYGPIAAAQSAPATNATSVEIPLVQNGKAAAAIVTAGRTDGWLMQHAVLAIQDTVRRWSGTDIPVTQAHELTGGMPAKPAVILATLDDLRRQLPKLAALTPLIERVAFLDEHGFVCTTQTVEATPCTFVVGRTPRGVYNGAVWLKDFCIDGTQENLSITCTDTVRNPQLPGRAVYALTIWAHEAEYTAADWEKIFDSFARDGFDRIYFWVSGHFPSQRFPQAVKCRDDKWDTTEKSKIATVEDLQRIIRAAHDRGMTFYAGGALGGWCCTYNLTHLAPGTMKTAPKDAPYPEPSSLCPSHPDSRRALIAYYQEVFDGLPEADGLFIESADEWGNCYCSACDQTINDLGSRQFGQSQLSLVQQIMQTVWRKHPQARLAYTVGYAEHVKDPAYYEIIRNMSDPRLEWMEARESWNFPALTGQDLPAGFFSRQVMRWQQYYTRSLDQLMNDAKRVAESGMYGCITAFEPGFSTGSFHKAIPYPMHQMPYILTGFVWREATWSPMLTTQAMRERIQQRFFGREASCDLSQHLWDLRELIREASSLGKKKKRTPAMTEAMLRIEQSIQKAHPTAGPKTRETLDLMTQAIADIRTNTN